MALSAAIFDRLSNDEAVAALVGERIEPDQSTTDIFPLIVYEIQPDQDQTLSQDSVTLHYNVIVTIEALTRDKADEVAKAVKAALNDQEWITGSTKIVACTFLSATTDSASAEGNKEVTYHGTEQTFSIYADNG